MNDYSVIARYYDELNCDCPYSEYSDFIWEAFEKYGDVSKKKLCDYGCGTGALTALLAQRGFEVTAFDISEEELSVAENRVRNMGLSARFLLSDLRRFDGNASYNIGVCTMDCVNYLVLDRDVEAFFESVKKTLSDGGIFIFDVNTLYRFEKVYGDNAYVLESENAFLGWQNEYNPKSKRCRFYLTLFTENADGSYTRNEEVHTEKYHSVKKLLKLIEKQGLETVGVFGNTDFSPLTEESEKAYFVLRKTK